MTGSMEEFYEPRNISEYQTLWLYQNFVRNINCSGQGGCETDAEVGWIQYVLELVMMPSVGVIGVVGNLISILVLGLTDDKSTFKHVIYLIYLRNM